MARKAKAKPQNNALKILAVDDDDVARATAAAILAPAFRHGVVAAQTHKAQYGKLDVAPGLADYAEGMSDVGKRAKAGDLAFASELLAAQALSLDGIFTEMARRMALNMGEYLGATETYARIAMKAQAQSRATLEALAKLHQPREQTVRHVHVNEGGQAVVADHFHHHHGGQENGQSSEQPDAQCPCRPPMLGTDESGNGVPITSDQGGEALQAARRERQRRTEG
jgi:hypothetical protein